MCGILCLVRFAEPGATSTAPLVQANRLVRHRGPDDEGYLLWRNGTPTKIYAGDETATASREAHRLTPLPAFADYQVAFGHRRLTILDLSPAGHQPMVHPPTRLAIVYNGEIYNYLELRRELERQGHSFTSHTDTEVLLAAWSHWGAECLHRLNGMFAFVLLDPRGGGTLHAVRDRFGVKPLYWARVGEFLAFASEIKQIRSLPGFSPRLDQGAVRDYLAMSLLDHTKHTFDESIQQLRGGERAVVNLAGAEPKVEITRWYQLQPEAWNGSEIDAAVRFRELLTDSVRLRLRADVAVGSCLSGGLDSSAIVCLAQELLAERNGHAPQITVTSCFKDAGYDEWRFAEEVVRLTGATSIRVWPTFEQLQRDLDRHLWHLDDPCGSTSQFSQWCVFSGAAEAGLKVMLSGQGSDEQLAGYGGNFAALLTGLLRRAAGSRAVTEALAFHKKNNAWPLAESLMALRNLFPIVDAFLPRRLKAFPGNPAWLKLDAPSHAPWRPGSGVPRDLNDSLVRQTLETSLPALLRFEDRISMAWSIESRVPFLDYRLVEFLAGLPDHFKLHKGLTKRVMREGLRGILPEAIRDRRDKMGFVAPQKIWLLETATDWFRHAVAEALDTAPDLFYPDRVTKMLDEMISGQIRFSHAPWRVICMGKWLNLNTQRRESVSSNV
jgi:asparagine synthase (glutamine-hydrolysing)